MYHFRMTMVSFRCDDETVAAVDRWAAKLRVDRSQLLREAVRLHLNRLAVEDEDADWSSVPPDDGQQALAAIAEWGPAEDWSDWADAAG